MQKSEQISPRDVLAGVPHVNGAATVRPGDKGGALAEIPVKRPAYMVPPISWVFPVSKVRRVRLDEIGVAVLNLCNGRRSLEQIIETFALEHRLSFHEARVPVTRFTQMLVERGVVAIAGTRAKGRA